MAERKTGTVKWFNAVKGFGFVTPNEGGEDLFVHQTNINAEGFRSLREGETVEFEVEAGTDGRAKAINVTGPEGATPQGAPTRSSSKVSNPGQPDKAGPSGPGGPGGPGGPMMGPGGRGGARGGEGRMQQRMPPGPGRGFYGYPTMPPFYVGYYFPEDPSGAHGRGRRMAGHPPPMYFPGPVPPGMMSNPMHQPHQPPPQSSGLQVVVHNLPWHCTWQQLKDLFKDWKVERADIVMDQYGRSRGFGTVRLTSTADVESACQKLNNSKFEERSISVRVDRFA